MNTRTSALTFGIIAAVVFYLSWSRWPKLGIGEPVDSERVQADDPIAPEADPDLTQIEVTRSIQVDQVQGATSSEAATLAIEVVDSSGSPMGGTVVKILAGGPTLAWGTTDSSGRLTLTTKDDGVVSIQAIHGQQVEELHDVVVLRASPAWVRIVFASRTVLRVVALLESGLPVEGAEVAVQGGPSLWVPRSGSAKARREVKRTDQHGRAEFSCVSEAPVTVFVTKSSLYAPAETVRVGSGELFEVPIVLHGGHQVTLRVVEKGTDNPIAALPIQINLARTPGTPTQGEIGIRVTDHEGCIRFSRPNGRRASCFTRGVIEWHVACDIPPDIEELVVEAAGGGSCWCRPILPPGMDPPLTYAIEYLETWNPVLRTEGAEVHPGGVIRIQYQGAPTSPQYRIRAGDEAISRWRFPERTIKPVPIDVQLEGMAEIRGRLHGLGSPLDAGSAMIEIYATQQTFMSALVPPLAKLTKRQSIHGDGEFRLAVPGGEYYELRIRGGLVHGDAFRTADLRSQREADIGVIQLPGAGTVDLMVERSGKPLAFCYGWLVAPKSLWDTGDTTRRLFRTDHSGRVRVEGLYPMIYDVVLSGSQNEPPDVVPASILPRVWPQIAVRSGESAALRVAY